jgi:hypothetical protein
MNINITILAIALLLTSCRAVTPTPGELPGSHLAVSVLSPCQILAKPKEFLGKRVTIRGYVTNFREHNGISGAECNGKVLAFGLVGTVPAGELEVEKALAEARVRPENRVYVTIVGDVGIYDVKLPNPVINPVSYLKVCKSDVTSSDCGG